MEIIDVDEIKKLNPFFDTAGVLAGAWTLDDGHGDPAGLCNAMARGATNMGAKIVKHNRVTDIRPLPSGEWEVVTDNGNVVAETVVNAAGCYARQVSQMVGTDLPISNMQHQYLVTGPIQEFVDREEEIRHPIMLHDLRTHVCRAACHRVAQSCGIGMTVVERPCAGKDAFGIKERIEFFYLIGADYFHAKPDILGHASQISEPVEILLRQRQSNTARGVPTDVLSGQLLESRVQIDAVGMDFSEVVIADKVGALTDRVPGGA